MKPRNDSKEFLSAINEDEELDDDSGSLLDITDKTDIYVEYEKNKNLYLSSGSILTSNRAMIQNQRIKLKERSKDISEAQYARLKNLKFLRYITMFVFFAVQMLTVPRWCLIDDNIKDKTWCDNDIYLNFDIPKISIYVSYPIEMACVIIVSATVLSKRMIRNLTINERLREAIVLLVSAAIIIEKSIILIVDGAPFICDFLKPLLVYSVFRNLREATTRTLFVFWKSKGMILFLLIYYGLLGWISNRMFVGTSWSTLHFASRESGIWSMMEVYGGSNFLIKALPSFNSNRIAGIIFFIFNLLGVVFFMTLVTAILYHVYKAEVSERVQNFKSTVDKALAKIFDKFKSENEETLSYPEALQAIKHVIKEHTRGEYKKISLDNVISIMDRANLGRIDRERFYECFDILYVLLEIMKKKKKLMQQRKQKLPRWKEIIERIYTQNLYSAIIHLINIFSLLLMFWREVMEAYGISNIEVLPQWITIALTISVIYLIDLIFAIIHNGILKSLMSLYILVEICCQLLSISGLIYFIIIQDYFYIVKICELVILVRIIKLLKLLEEIEQWRLVVLALKRMITPFLALFIVQLGIVYTYAIFGERIYGGQISTNIIRKMSNANFGKEFLSMNFNGLLISMATLFYFSLAWPQLIKLFLIAVPGFISYAYTFSYFVFSFLCLWRIMIFVAIEVYVTIKTLHTSNSEELKAHRKILQKDDGGLLVQDLAASKIIKKYKLLEFEEQKSISKKFNSPKVKSNRTLLEDQTYKSAGRRTEL